MRHIAPSFLSADIWRAGEQLSALEAAGCKYIHFDIMDGHFVPNISYGPDWVKKLRPHSKMVFDTHLMVEEPDFLLEAFANSGSDYCVVHVEAVTHLMRTLDRIRDLGMKPGVALNPGTPLVMLEEVLPLCDLVLVMSVNPGFGGQKFIPSALDKLARLKKQREERGLNFLIEVDGGVCPDNAAQIAAAGADLLVAGNAVFGQADIVNAFEQLEKMISEKDAEMLINI